MKLLLIAYIVLLAALQTDGQQLPSGRTINKQVSATCQRNMVQGTFTLTLAINFNNDPVDRVQFLNADTYVPNAVGGDNEVPCQIQDGAVSSNGYVIYKSTVLADGTPVLNGCGGRASANNGIKWTLLTREFYANKILTDMDRLYTVVCTPANSNSNYLTTSVNIFENDLEGDSVRIKPLNQLVVLKRDSGNDFTLELGSGVTVRQQVKLRVMSQVKTGGLQVENIDHYGSYVYKCDYWFDVNGPKTEFIANNGCPNNHFPDLASGFTHGPNDYSPDTSTQRWFNTETDGFILLDSSPPTHNIHISCYVDYCYGAQESDSRCTNYCGTNGRRKRQVGSNHRDQVSVTITVLDTADDTPSGSGEQNESKNNDKIIIGVVSGVIALLFIVGLVVLAVVCCRYQAAGSRKERWDSSSTSSSRQNLPQHLTDAHLKNPKF